MRHADLVKRVLAKRLQESLVDNNAGITNNSDIVPKDQDKSNLLQSTEVSPTNEVEATIKEKSLEKEEAPSIEESSKKKNFSSKKKKNASSST